MLQAALLDDVVRKLGEVVVRVGRLEETIKRTIPKGIKEETTQAVGTDWVKVEYPDCWFSYTIFNDGPSPVYISINKKPSPGKKLEAPLNKGEILSADLGNPVIKSIWLKCETDSASVRIHLSG